MKKRILPIVATVAIFLSLAACQGLDNWLFDRDTPPPTPVPPESAPPTMPATPTGALPGNLFGVPWSGQTSIQPLTDDNRFNAQWLPLVYEGLFQLDDAFEPQPLLCSQYNTQDNTTFVFTLRRGVTFHDGAPLTAADAVWSLITALYSEGPYAARLSDLLEVTERSETTFEIVLARPNPRLPALLTIPIVPADSDLMDTAPGTGPYMPVVDDDYPHLDIFRNWWQQKSMPLSRLELIAVTSGDQLIYNFESTTLSLLIHNSSDVNDVRFRGDYESWEYDTPIMEFIGFNVERTHVDNSAVRRAIASGLDRLALIPDKTEPRPFLPAVLPIHPSCPLYDLALAESNGFDPQRLATLLSEAGYQDTDEDGVLEVTRGRRTYPLNLTMVVSMENAHYAETAHSIAEALTDAGISVQVRELSAGDYLQAIQDGDFDLYYGVSTMTPDFSPTPFFADGSLGFGRYADPETIELWEQAALKDAGSSAWDAFWKRFVEEAPIVPILFQRQELMLQRGLTTEPDPTWENIFYHLSSWVM